MAMSMFNMRIKILSSAKVGLIYKNGIGTMDLLWFCRINHENTTRDTVDADVPAAPSTFANALFRIELKKILCSLFLLAKGCSIVPQCSCPCNVIQYPLLVTIRLYPPPLWLLCSGGGGGDGLPLAITSTRCCKLTNCTLPPSMFWWRRGIVMAHQYF